MTVPTGYDPSRFPPFAVTADSAVFTNRAEELNVLMVRRANDPYRGRWALPGGFVDIDEDLASAARRELKEETGLDIEGMAQLGTYGTPGRDPRMRVVTVVYMAHVDEIAEPVAGDDAAEARFWPVDALTSAPDLLAFDHLQILTDAIAALSP